MLEGPLDELLELTSLIGNGQYSSVFKGRRKIAVASGSGSGSGDQVLALKVYTPKQYRENKREILNEIAVLSALNHPSTCVLKEGQNRLRSQKEHNFVADFVVALYAFLFLASHAIT